MLHYEFILMSQKTVRRATLEILHRGNSCMKRESFVIFFPGCGKTYQNG